MKRIKYLNENGSMSILIVFAVATISAILVLKASSAFDSVNKLHSRQRQKVNLQPHMHKLAQLIQQSYDSAQVDPGCSGVGKGDFAVKKINGSNFCIHKSKGLCIGSSQGNSENLFCLSTKKEAFEWKNDIKFKKISKQEPILSQTKDKFVKNNRIVIPNTSVKRIWRDCSSSTCVRLVLCPEGKNNCAVDEAIATQVVRLGALE